MKTTIGVPKEVKPQENRVSVTPSGVKELTTRGHIVFVETNAGLGSGFSDADYEAAGAIIHNTPQEVYLRSEIIVKVKEPLPSEYSLIKAHHTIFTYFHFAASQELTDTMLAKGCTCISYETVTAADGSLPLLVPMSQVAGRLASQFGAHYLLSQKGGKGKLMGGVPGVEPANVLVLGGGIVGTNAAWVAAGMGAKVTIMDISAPRLNYLDTIMPKNVNTLFSNEYNIEKLLPTVDMIIGAVLIPGGKAPSLIKAEMLTMIEKGSVLLDIAVDQGGCIDTVETTSHKNPILIKEGVLHYGVPNMPGAVPKTSTQALANTTLPFLIQLANKGWKLATTDNIHLRNGLNLSEGKIYHKQLAKDFGLELHSFE